MTKTVYLGSWRVGDLEPSLTVRLLADGEPLDISTADSASITVGDLVDAAPASIIDDGSEAQRGLVRYAWSSGQTSTAGLHNTEVKLTWSVGRVQTFPGDNTRALVRISASV